MGKMDFKEGKHGLFVVFVLMLVAAIIMCMTSCKDKGTDASMEKTGQSASFNSYNEAEKYKAGDFSYDSDQIKEIDVDWIYGDINIVQGSGKNISVKETGGALEDGAKVHWYVDGTDLKIKFCASDYNGDIEANQKNITIEIPENIDLQIDTVSGDVKCGDITVRDFEVDSASGSVTIEKLFGSDAEVDSTSGDVKIGVADCREVNVDTTSGNIDLSPKPQDRMLRSSIGRGGMSDLAALFFIEFRQNLCYTVFGE